MTCQAIVTAMGFHCNELRSDKLFVGTPFTFSDGTTIGFYITTLHPAGPLRISDNADTLFHMLTIGLSEIKPATLKHRLHPFDITLSESGELFVDVLNQELLPGAVSRFIQASLVLATYEHELFVMTAAERSLATEVESLLRIWRPDEQLLLAPHVRGRSGASHEFSFQLGSQLVQCLRPNGRSTGSLLRRTIDIQPDTNANTVLVVMDDRANHAKASSESQIINMTGLFQVITITRLAELTHISLTRQ